MNTRYALLRCLLRLVLAVLCLWAASRIFDPLLMEQRPWLLLSTLLVAAGLFYWEMRVRTPDRRGLREGVALATLAVSLLAFLYTVQQGAQLWWARRVVEEAPSMAFIDLGRHIIVGYTDIEEVSRLAEQGMIGGIYIGKRNVQGRNPTQIRDEIAGLQQLRRDKGLPPLWVAADQEGGIVSHLSPPLPLLAPLSQIVASVGDASTRSGAVQSYASLQGRHLAHLGVNLNLAPVVDLNHGVHNPDDRYSRISARAISSDPAVVSSAAADFCSGLAQNNVHCTFKHFPGLGRVYADTHRSDATLNTPLPELMRSDWLPFRTLMGNPGSLTMLGHARVAALDPHHPTSFSPRVIGMLRQDWHYDGLLITDDFCMGAVYGHPLGIGGAAIAALNAGADLILISYDPAQYYRVMQALLKAQAEGRLRGDALERSERRLANRWSQDASNNPLLSTP